MHVTTHIAIRKFILADSTFARRNRQSEYGPDAHKARGALYQDSNFSRKQHHLPCAMVANSDACVCEEETTQRQIHATQGLEQAREDVEDVW
ncbi:unnamed protein product [marine sediment metagenome]|uniref:Uncharacterized protein n=1 Tax=marine sediment metagenome TaxID=412755 RepID=X0VQJ4_9ZZZZ